MHARQFSLRTAIVACAALLLSTAIAPARQTKNANPDEAALIRLENHWLNVEHDPDALESILAEDFVHVLPDGFISKDEQISYWRKNPTPSRPRHFGEMRVRIYGDAGIVTGTVVHDSPGANDRRTAFTDVFVRRNGEWQAVNAQELLLKQSPN